MVNFSLSVTRLTGMKYIASVGKYIIGVDNCLFRLSSAVSKQSQAGHAVSVSFNRGLPALKLSLPDLQCDMHHIHTALSEKK